MIALKGVYIMLIINSMTQGYFQSQARMTLKEQTAVSLKEDAGDAKFSMVEIGELIFDETITKVGRDFYTEFFTLWENPTKIQSFSISIKERPMPGLGTQLRVLIDEDEIFNQFMRPNNELIEMMAEYAVQMAQSYLVNYEQIQNQLINEDQMGTGIF